jgi:hypothetical protein
MLHDIEMLHMGRDFTIRLYRDESFLEKWDRFKKLARQEATTISNLVEMAIDEFIKKHEKGNPQLPLTRFAEGPYEPTRIQPCRHHEVDSKGIHWCRLRGVGSRRSPCETCTAPMELR